MDRLPVRQWYAYLSFLTSDVGGRPSVNCHLVLIALDRQELVRRRTGRGLHHCSGKAAVKADDPLFRCQHRNDHGDECYCTVERAMEMDPVAKSEVDRREDHELRSEEYGPGDKEVKGPRRGAFF